MRFSGYNRYQCFCSAVSSLLLLSLLSFAVGAALTRADDVGSDADAGSASRKWLCSRTDICTAEGEMVTGLQYAPEIFESQRDCRLSCGKYGAIWPMPTGKECTISHRRVRFDPWKVRFHVVAPGEAATQFLRETNRLFVSNLLKECIRNCTLETSKQILVRSTVANESLVLDWPTDESYALVVRTTETATFVDIQATTVYGARHAFETLSNLVTGSLSNGLLMVTTANITDRPAFSHRGVLLDTARNFVPLKFIRSTLDAMAASKLNVLHWHVVDTHSFPLEITRVPEMQRYGAYSSSQTYSRQDALNLVKYARLRGIRILIEIDGPSHAGNGWQWGPAAGLGNMSVCLNQSPWRRFCVQPPCGQLNPLNDHMYAVLKEIFEDVAEVGAPEETLHMGGDEVFLWNSNPPQEPKSVIIWSSHLTNPRYIEAYLPKERFIIQTWVESQDALNRELLQRGYRLIVSTKNAWYLDHGFWGSTSYYNWRTVYSSGMPVGRSKDQVLGGEVCMWSEYVDQNSLESRIWPRAGAAAERMWSNPKSSALLAQRRFYRYRERLLARGIHADAVIPHWCVLHEGQCL
ncbi:GD16914 [Drosophila simulans]|uniref:beta-N-acetylhexosaminidase n=1 Tax=Drosophila simulans TaxID=7240 RepID=B4R6L3_DROSI|nr:GD16914 [Drosophila simulans]